MKYYFRYFFLTISLFLTNGCTSLQAIADKHFESGQYEEAASVYEDILKEKPDDTETKSKLKLSYQKILDNNLIKVRLQRLSANFEEAYLIFSSIIEMEKKYSISPSGVAFSTQLEESKYLLDWLMGKINNEIAEKKYLKSRITLEKYSKVFTDDNQVQILSKLTANIAALGVSHCSLLMTNSSNEFSKQLSSRYCLYWGHKSNLSREPSASTGIKGAFSDIKILGNITNIPSDALTSINEELIDGFKKSPYYSANSISKLSATYSGHFNNSYTEKPVILTHSYTVQIPYQAIETQPYIAYEPYTCYHTEYVYSQYGSYSYEKPSTCYNWVTKYNDVYVTRYRTEPRVFQYSATEYNLSYTLVGKIKLPTDGINFEVPLNSQDSYVDTFHSNNNSEIGLKAKPRDILTPIDWIKKQVSSINKNVEEKLVANWESKYCVTPTNLTATNQINVVAKCIYGARQKFDFVDNWFKEQFGVEKEEILAALKG